MYGDTPAPSKRLRVSLNAPVTLVFAALCVCATALGVFTQGAATELLFSTHRSSLLDPLMYVRLFTHALGHSGWDHLIGNMSYILLLGPLLEEKYGSPRLAVIILVSALVCSITSILIFHTGGVGASGVVFTFILLSSVTNLREGEIPLTFILVAALYFGQQIYGAIFVGGNISYHGHIAGGLVGAAVGFLLPEKSGARTSGSGYGSGY